MRPPLYFSPSFLCLLLACGSEPAEEPGTVRLTFAAASSAANASALASSTQGLDNQGSDKAEVCAHATDPCSATYRASWSLSGAPEQMTVYLKRIALNSGDGGGTEVEILNADPAIALPLQNGVVDITQLLSGTGLAAVENSDGSQSAEAEVAAGTYSNIKLVFENRAIVRGCLEEAWQASQTGCAEGENTQGSVESGGAVGEPAADKCDPMVATDAQTPTYTFCTKSAYSSDVVFQDDAHISRSVFQRAGGDLTEPEDVQLTLAAWGSGENADDISADFSAEVVVRRALEPFTVAPETPVTLTLALDLNTALRFEANTRTEGTNPFNSMRDGTVVRTLDKPFFYLQNPSDMLLPFVGAPGAVQSYITEQCYFFGGRNPQNREARALKGAITLFLSPDGDEVVSGNVSPVDEAGFILLKGSLGQTEPNADGTFDFAFENGNGGLRGFQLAETPSADAWYLIGREGLDKTTADSGMSVEDELTGDTCYQRTL